MFEIGFVINRISSILVEPILIKFKIWPRDGYSIDISEISQSNPKFQSMITEINLMRSHIFIYFVSCIMSFFLRKMEFSIISFFLIIVFVFGGRKHNNKINTIRKEYNKQKKREQDTKLEAERKIREAEDNFMYI